EADGDRPVAILDQGTADERWIGNGKRDGLGFGEILRLRSREPAPRIAGAVDELLPAAHRLRPLRHLLLLERLFIHIGEAVGLLVFVKPSQRLLAGRAFLEAVYFERHVSSPV